MSLRRRACRLRLPAIVTTGAVATLSAFGVIGPASAAGTASYVALGDSYSSGDGAGNYSGGSCLQSANAYPVLWHTAHGGAFANETCAGATTADVLSGQLGALSAGTTLVSITIGGNDVGFSSVMETCVLRSTSTCVAAINAAEGEVSSELPGELDRVLAAITAHAPGARVVVLGYPHLYDLARSATCIGLSTTDRTDLNQAADLLDGQIQAAAARHGDVFADVRAAFAGHENCDGASSWLHAVNFFDLSESYHPTAAGQSGGYLPAFSASAG
jgi:lysophospholipase L1-like esterase